MPHGRDRARWRDGQGNEVASHALNLITVAHPHDRIVRNIMKERLGRVERPAFHSPEFTARRIGKDGNPKGFTYQLHPVTDPEDRNAELENPWIAVRGARLVDARRPAGEDDRQRIKLADALGSDVVADNPGKGVALANPSRDELNVLSAKVEDKYRSLSRVGVRHECLRQEYKA